MPLFRFLHSVGEISQEDVQRLRRTVREESLHPIEALAEEIDAERVAELITSQLGLPLIDLASTTVEQDVLRTVSRELASRYDVFPVQKRGDRIVLAMANPLESESLKAIQFASRAKIEPAVASLPQIRAAVRRNYFLKEELESFLATAEGKDRLDVIAATSLDEEEVAEDGEQKATVVRLVEMLLLDGLRLGASDIHIEPAQDAVVVRYRVNGVLESGMTLPKQLNSQVVSRIKIMAELDITERRRPQDGGIRITHQTRHVDVRVSILPTKAGEKVVLRLLDPEAKGHTLQSMGFEPSAIDVLRSEARRPEGLILISGPTGSGKSTTAHAMLSDISETALNIVTIENPIEHRLAGVTQVEVNDKQGITFAGTLRSILRQDPDVIFVGEIRDEETAKIALQASQTGHLVITTVHTIDATSSITRLLDLGLDPLLISASLRLAIAQRLVRVGCPSCRTAPRAPTDVETARLERYDGELTSVTTFEGCPRCRGTGYVGRTGIYELVPVSQRVRSAIEHGAGETEIRGQIRAEGIASMPSAAIRAVNEGRTTVDEVVRVIPPEEVSQAKTAKEPVTSSTRGVRVRPDRPKVLVVDDDRELAEMIRETLERSSLNLDVRATYDAEGAIEVLEHDEVHLALLDIGLPGSSGTELCARIRAHDRWQGLPLFMLTARDDDEAKVEAFRAGADDYVVKPIRSRELAARVGRALDREYGPATAPATSTRSAGARPPIEAAPERPRKPETTQPAPETVETERIATGPPAADTPERPPTWSARPQTHPRKDAWKKFLGQPPS